jgi:FKBP-type peptidyl-prolyl cis-trans isomerase (trigger factor)
MKTTISRLTDQSAVEIVGELDSQEVGVYRSPALKRLGAELRLDGFRPGHIPEEIIAKTIGEDKLLLEMAELALADYYPKIIVEHKLDPIGHPEVKLTKAVPGEPLGFTITTAVAPEFTLPDYKKLAKEINAGSTEKPEATPEEVEKLVEELKKQPNFKATPDLTARAKASLEAEKAWRQKDKRRLEIIEKIIAETKVTLPTTLVESMLDRMVAELKGEIEQSNLKFADYLTHIKKDIAGLREEMKPQAEKRVQVGLILEAIADKEKLEPTAEKVAEQSALLRKRYPTLPEPNVKSYIVNLLRNDLVWQLLESQV